MALTASQVYSLARKEGGLDDASAIIATAVAQGESGFDPSAKGDTGIEDETWGPSVGLWQVRSLKAQRGTGGVRDEVALTDPAHNARSMGEISATGRNFTAWTVYRSGKYRQYVPSIVVELKLGEQQGGPDWYQAIAGALPGAAIAGGVRDAAGAVGGAVDAAKTLAGLVVLVGKAAAWLADWHHLLRVAEVIGGGVGLVVAVDLLARDLEMPGNAGKVASMAAKAMA